MIALALFVFGSALAGPPEKPHRMEPIENECSAAIGIVAGERFQAIDSDSRATCSGVLIPTSEVFYLQRVKTWAFQNDAYMRNQIAQANLQAETAKSEANRAQKTSLWISVASISVAASIALFQ